MPTDMTDSEIDALDGPELSASVAVRAMGWIDFSHTVFPYLTANRHQISETYTVWLSADNTMILASDKWRPDIDDNDTRAMRAEISRRWLYPCFLAQIELRGLSPNDFRVLSGKITEFLSGIIDSSSEIQCQAALKAVRDGGKDGAK